ncbi:ATP-binding cassette domain-containing protein [Actinoallomurus rhizosphaericola]|uniref:ATP-binding cassette domain-containing protein n=1 Tax=Actinoallomurus rhizosphaericola TaxID=2952536 RepID=UPI002090DCB2|nr:ABC transporter ATP-binding protein [Actinoallomurus rhizosphaericola]MCO5993881.1 ABC transporter ATP-binding protein/permease [Actinoallomurus rhizosphaericola]
MSDIRRAVRLLLTLAWRTDRGRLLRAALLMLVGYVATPLIAVCLKVLTDRAVAHDPRAVWAALAAAVLLVFELMMAHFAHLSYFELGEMEEETLNSTLIELAGRPDGLRRFDSPDFADTLRLVREDLMNIRMALAAVLQLGGVLLQTAVATVILARVSPLLILLLAAALPPVIAGRRAQRIIDRAQEAEAERTRLVNHLLRLATSAGSVKELRLYRAERELAGLQAALWSRITAASWRAHRRAAALRAAGQTVFGVAYGGAVLLVATYAARDHARLGDVVLIITLAVQVSAQVSEALSLLSTLQTAGRTAGRLDRLRSGDAAEPAGAARAVPDRLRRGIRLEGVGFRYSAGRPPVLRDVTVDLPAGGTVVVVGENGAGKSTLVKLLCGLYEPTAGSILVDGVPLSDVAPDAWRRNLAVMYQDFSRFQLTLRESVGVGDLARSGDDTTVLGALERAGAGGIATKPPEGLSGLVGTAYGDGTELSGGQWQSVALARSLMRTEPLLLVMDEPTAALDAAAESAIFERYRESARRAAERRGAITLFVSHRFSTVHKADLIVVLDQGRVAELGRHADLLAAGGKYAELFRMHARVYE